MAGALEDCVSPVEARQTVVHDAGGAAEAPGTPRSGDPVGGGAAARLDQRTHLDSGHYRIVLRDYGGGLGEIGWSFIPSRVPSKAGRGESENAEANRDRAVRRARSRLRQLILATRADHLLTLTYRNNVNEFERACEDLSKFVRIIRRLKPDWTYIAVAERQARGAWHWHLAVRGRQDVGLLRASWRRVVGDGKHRRCRSSSCAACGTLGFGALPWQVPG